MYGISCYIRDLFKTLINLSESISIHDPMEEVELGKNYYNIQLYMSLLPEQ